MTTTHPAPTMSEVTNFNSSTEGLSSLIALAEEAIGVEYRQEKVALVSPHTGCSLTSCLHTLIPDGSGLLSDSSPTVANMESHQKDPPTSNSSPILSSSGNGKVAYSSGTNYSVMVKPTTPVDLLETTQVYFADDIDNFNVVQEETVPMEPKSDEEIETFVPPINGKICTTYEGVSNNSLPISPRPISTKSYICGECGKTFATKRNRSHHIKVIHVSEQTFSCQVCSKVFRHFHNMNIHKQNQNHFTPDEQHLVKPRRKFECPVCQKTFQQKSNLVAHSRIHSGERPFKCSFCDRRFVQNSNCKKHELTHTYKRPFNCYHCPKSFTSSCNLQRHQMSHHQGKNYLCPFCGKSFTQKWNLKKHEKRHVEDTSEPSLVLLQSDVTEAKGHDAIANSSIQLQVVPSKLHIEFEGD